jgi:two-component system response regulator AtoC
VNEDALTRVLATVLANGNAHVDEPPPCNVGPVELLGASAHLLALRELIARVARAESTVLVRGETGTGKELVARAVHAESTRRTGPFIKVHAAALPEELLESELFGYEKGAFTGATARKPGRVELAQGGTLFLDEIGEISLRMQAKLLRLIQDREYERLGGARTLKADVRFVTATHRDLEHMLEKHTFREDLFFRLKVVTIWLPPLRARRDDIPLIANHYLGQFRSANRKPAMRFEAQALELLKGQRWGGNVRELVNFIERLVVVAGSDGISAADVRRELIEHETFTTQSVPNDAELARVLSASIEDVASARMPAPAPTEPAGAAPEGVTAKLVSAVRPLKQEVYEAEHRALLKALSCTRGNRTLAARMLGVSRRTFYTKLDEHGLA